MVTEGIDITIPTYYDARTYQRSEPHAWSRRAAGVDVQLRVPRGARAKGSSAARGPSNHRPGPGASVPAFRCLYVHFGRPSVAPEKLLRALLLQALYTIRSERQLMEQLDYNLLFRWFVGLSLDEAVWSPTTFTKNRDRLLTGDIATAFFDAILIHADTARLLSDEHFTVDGPLLEAWASQKSFRPRDEDPPSFGRQ